MAAGDAQRVWFREMVERLRDQWHPEMPFEAIISLRDDLDTTLQRIRSEGHIESPVFRCPRCGHVGPGATPHVSATGEEVRGLEKRWAVYRKQNSLDPYGKQTAPEPAENSECTQPSPF